VCSERLRGTAIDGPIVVKQRQHADGVSPSVVHKDRRERAGVMHVAHVGDEHHQRRRHAREHAAERTPVRLDV
jgi:hypothetical protein